MNGELAASSIGMVKPAFVALVALVCLTAPIVAQTASQKPTANKVEITLVSDGLTQVWITDVMGADKFLAKFTEKKVHLPPGSYIVAGRRVRYMDLNYTLEVKPDTPATLTVICTVSLDAPTSR